MLNHRDPITFGHNNQSRLTLSRARIVLASSPDTEQRSDQTAAYHNASVVTGTSADLFFKKCNSDRIYVELLSTFSPKEHLSINLKRMQHFPALPHSSGILR